MKVATSQGAMNETAEARRSEAAGATENPTFVLPFRKRGGVT